MTLSGATIVLWCATRAATMSWSCGRMDASDVLFEIQDLEEVEAVQRNLVFEEGQRGVRCACIGYPGIDWYRGETLVAETSVQHGRAIRWYEVPGDATLTGKSEEWLVQWLVSNGVPKSNLSLAKDRNSSRQQHVTMVMMLAGDDPCRRICRLQDRCSDRQEHGVVL